MTLTIVKYTGEPCRHCGRNRVELYSDGRLICEKCQYNPVTESFESEDQLFEQMYESDSKYKYLDEVIADVLARDGQVGHHDDAIDIIKELHEVYDIAEASGKRSKGEGSNE